MNSSLRFNLKSRGKPIRGLPEQLSTESSHSSFDVHNILSRAIPLSAHRLRISQDQNGRAVVPSDRSIAIGSLGLKTGDTLFVKDLGPQMGWRTVYMIEYLGPLFIHPLLFRYRLSAHHPTPSQVLTLYLILLHFSKREIESIFVHRFSNATMPARNVIKNSAHYWFLSGVLLAWFVYSPQLPFAMDSSSSSPSSSSTAWDSTISVLPVPTFSLLKALPLSAHFGLILYVLGASLNTHVHWIQRNLRPKGTTIRRIPTGPGFSWVTCPNYLFETLAWTGIFVISQSWATAAFILVAVLQMKAWAGKKEARYRREFPGSYVSKRYGVIPGLF